MFNEKTTMCKKDHHAAHLNEKKYVGQKRKHLHATAKQKTLYGVLVSFNKRFKAHKQYLIESNYNHLPSEIITLIAQFTDLNSLSNLMLVNKEHYYSLLENELLWSTKSKRIVRDGEIELCAPLLAELYSMLSNTDQYRISGRNARHIMDCLSDKRLINVNSEYMPTVLRQTDQVYKVLQAFYNEKVECTIDSSMRKYREYNMFLNIAHTYCCECKSMYASTLPLDKLPIHSNFGYFIYLGEYMERKGSILPDYMCQLCQDHRHIRIKTMWKWIRSESIIPIEIDEENIEYPYLKCESCNHFIWKCSHNKEPDLTRIQDHYSDCDSYHCPATQDTVFGTELCMCIVKQCCYEKECTCKSQGINISECEFCEKNMSKFYIKKWYRK